MNDLFEQARKKAGYRSNDAFAKAMLKHKPGLGNRIQPRSLGVKLGGLLKGNSDWWRKNPDFMEVLTELLNVDLSDLGIHAGNADHLFVFDEFPELPPLDLRREIPCTLAYGVANDGLSRLKGEFKPHPLDLQPWMTDRELANGRNMPHGITWLHAPSSLGADLLIAQLKVRSAFEVLEVPSIQDARIRFQAPKPFVLALSLPVTIEDLGHLHIARESTVLVIAPNPILVIDGIDLNEHLLDWEFSNRSEQEQAQRIVSNPIFGVARYRWTLHNDWRQRLLSWVNSRLESKVADTLFDEQEAARWLNDFDPDEHIIRTPADLLTICRMFHMRSKRSRPAATGRDTARELQSKLVSLDSRHTDTFNQISEALWARSDLPWAAPLEWSVWRDLHRGENSQPAGANVAGRLSARQSSKIGRKAPSKKTERDGRLDELLSKGLLRCVPRKESGDYALNPQLLADLHVRHILGEQILSGDFQSWGRAALDAERQYLVDAALSATTAQDLLNTIRKLQAAEPWNPSVIGATESLFLELGSRRAEGQDLSPEMHFIAEVVFLRLMESGDAGASLLLTRGTAAVEGHPDALKLIAACFGWSLTHRPASSSGMDKWALQQFPGWATGSAIYPHLPDHPEEPEESTHGSPPRWRRFMKAAVNALLEIPGLSPALVEEKSNIIAPLFLVRALVQGNPLKPEWLHEVIDHRWSSDFVVEQLDRRHSDELASRTFGAILDCAFATLLDNTGNFTRWRTHFLFMSRIWRWAVENSTPSVLIPVADEKHLAVLRELPQALPLGWRSKLLESLSHDSFGGNVKLIGCVGGDAWQLLIALLGTIEGGEAAKRLWEINPLGVRTLLESNQLSHAAEINLILNSPKLLAVDVARHISLSPNLLDRPQRREWVISRLGSHVSNVDELLALLQ